MIKPQQTTGQKISSIGGTVGTVLGGLNMVKGLFTNKNDEDRRQLRQQGKLQELQIAGSKELADYEQDLKMKMWNDTNYGAQLAQAEKAGVSKAAAIGGSGTGTQGASVGGTTGGQAANAAQTEANEINKQMMMAQVANMQANTAKTVEETPVDYTVTDGLRTTAQQKALYAQGRTKKGKIVTNADGVYNKSKHQSGNAVDIYPYINGKIDINDKQNKLPIIAKHIKKTAEKLGYQLRWGGSWTSITDIPHFELQE